MNNYQLISLHQCDNRAAHIYRSTHGEYELLLFVRGAGLVDQQELDNQKEATELAFEFIRGAKFN